MHGLAVYVKEGIPFTQDLSLVDFAFSYLCFQLASLHSLSYSQCFTVSVKHSVFYFT